PRALPPFPTRRSSDLFEDRGTLAPTLAKDPYIARLLDHVRGVALKPLKIVCHAGNGCAGPVIDRLEPFLPIEWIRIDHEPDPTLDRKSTRLNSSHVKL